MKSIFTNFTLFGPVYLGQCLKVSHAFFLVRFNSSIAAGFGFKRARGTLVFAAIFAISSITVNDHLIFGVKVLVAVFSGARNATLYSSVKVLFVAVQSLLPPKVLLTDWTLVIPNWFL